MNLRIPILIFLLYPILIQPNICAQTLPDTFAIIHYDIRMLQTDFKIPLDSVVQTLPQSIKPELRRQVGLSMTEIGFDVFIPSDFNWGHFYFTLYAKGGLPLGPVELEFSAFRWEGAREKTVIHQLQPLVEQHAFQNPTESYFNVLSYEESMEYYEYYSRPDTVVIQNVASLLAHCPWLILNFEGIKTFTGSDEVYMLPNESVEAELLTLRNRLLAAGAPENQVSISPRVKPENLLTFKKNHLLPFTGDLMEFQIYFTFEEDRTFFQP